MIFKEQIAGFFSSISSLSQVFRSPIRKEIKQTEIKVERKNSTPTTYYKNNFSLANSFCIRTCFKATFEITYHDLIVK